uniref:coiled-coil domain-containing glutamate-rich protein 1 n=1 Tax=Callithrix jacchus TaxID=9483 RepID=UPI0001D37620|nr:coiled-coil domain-containing glutamate-rich protein 1 [Callithrix jacchus]XP_035113069.1 coiled-coil domain-containing glutamate-rich protein 1 [Callithrix jacchus]
MTETFNMKEDPVNLGGGGAHSSSLHSWSSCYRRRRGAPVYNRWHRYGPKTEYGPPRKQPKQQHSPGFWFQSPVCSNWGCWGGPWRPPPPVFWRPPGRVQVISVYGLHPLCFCCCSCWSGSWNPGWTRSPGKKKRWGRRGRRGRGPRHHPRRSSSRSPPGDLSMPLRPASPYEWRAPGLRAPRNTTQFIMDQIYEDMRQQKELERQQEAKRVQQAVVGGEAFPAGSSGNNAPPGGSEETWALQETLYDLVQNPLAFSPTPEENQSPAPMLVKEEEEEEKNDEYDQEVCDVKEESEEEEEEVEDDEEEEVEEAEYVEEGEEEEEEELEEEEEGLEENRQGGEEFHLPLEMPLSLFVGAEETRENFINCTFLNPEQIIPNIPQESLFLAQDFNC